MQSYGRLLLRIPLYNVFRVLRKPRIFPVNYTLSITNICPSRCKTCFIWKLYQENPKLKNQELSTSEWAEVIENLGESPFWVTVSGGEPFARNDLAKICKMICEINKPKIINIPTNGIFFDRIKTETPKILEACSSENVLLIINLSIDGIGEVHDKIRGVKSNWNKVISSLFTLKNLKHEYSNLIIGIHTVISNYNISNLLNIVKFVTRKLMPDHYVMEVAEERSELFNKGSNITPPPLKLKKALNEVGHYLEDYWRKNGVFEKIGQAFRFRYYDLIPQILEERRQIIPCMSSFASCQITPFGDLWACCILGYEKSIGNLKDNDFDFQKLWMSKRANKIREFIKEGNCFCPLANAHYTNLLLNFSEFLRIASKILVMNVKQIGPNFKANSYKIS